MGAKTGANPFRMAGCCAELWHYGRNFDRAPIRKRVCFKQSAGIEVWIVEHIGHRVNWTDRYLCLFQNLDDLLQRMLFGPGRDGFLDHIDILYSAAVVLQLRVASQVWPPDRVHESAKDTIVISSNDHILSVTAAPCTRGHNACQTVSVAPAHDSKFVEIRNHT